MKYVLFSIVLLASYIFPLPANAADYYISPAGSDTNSGTQTQPFATIQKGIDVSGPSDQVLIKAGTYFENLVIKNKTNLTIIPAGDGPVVIDGAIQPLTVKNQGNWHYEGLYHGSYPDRDFAVYSYDYPFSSAPYSANYYVIGNTIADADNHDTLFFTYSGATTFNLHHVAGMEGAGGYFTQNRAYLSLPGDLDPNTKSLSISRNAYVILITDNANHITLDGTKQKLITIKNGGRFGLLNRSFSTTPNTGNIFKNLKIINSVNGITFYSGGIFNDHLIENNYLERKTNPDWTWNDVKECDTTYTNYTEDTAKSSCKVLRDGTTLNSSYVSGTRAMEGSGINVSGVTGTHNVFRNNEIVGFHDGITFGSGPMTSSQISGNLIHNIQDDGLEFVGNCNYNDVFQNVVINPVIGISTAFGHTGPSYFHQNLILITEVKPMTYDFVNHLPLTWPGSGMKAYREYSGNIPQNVKIYYNTFSTLSDPVGIGSSVPGASVQNYELYNNIFSSQVRIVSATSQAIEDGTVIKSNLFYSTRNARQTGSKNYYNWNGYDAINRYYDLSDILNNQAMPVNWTNNLELNPQFAGSNLNDPVNYFQLTSNSPARTANGFILAPILSDWPNADSLNQRQSAGAYEYVAAPPPLPGDFNHDGVVDFLDLIYVITHFNQTGGTSIFDFNTLVFSIPSVLH